MRALRPVLDALPRLEVLVLGDALLDEYLYGEPVRLCREAPVPVVAVRERHAMPGGAGNTAVNAAALGAHIRMLSVVGDDEAGRVLTQALAGGGVDVSSLVVDPGRSTVAKRRLSAGEHMVARFDEGGVAPLTDAARQAVLERLPEVFAAADVVVVSDYGCGVMDDEVVAALARLHQDDPRVLVVDAHDIARYAAVGATALTPSYDEVRALLTDAPGASDRAERVLAQRDHLHQVTGAQVIAVTLDRDGAVVSERDRPAYRTWARPAPTSRTCGAGDSFTAAFALALAVSGETSVAAEAGQAAAAVVSAREGTSVCSADDLREHLAGTTTKLEPAGRLAERISLQRRQGRRVVFTNGCFDLLHRGHVDLLNRAKALGDVLVVGLNSDESIRELKGPDRPINHLEDRARVLAALSTVDHVVAFDEPTASGLIQVLQPDVYVKGGDYTPAMLPEAEHVEAYGGVVHILPYLEGRSTTSMIQRIRDDHRVLPQGNGEIRLDEMAGVEPDR